MIASLWVTTYVFQQSRAGLPARRPLHTRPQAWRHLPCPRQQTLSIVAGVYISRDPPCASSPMRHRITQSGVDDLS